MHQRKTEEKTHEKFRHKRLNAHEEPLQKHFSNAPKFFESIIVIRLHLTKKICEKKVKENECTLHY